MPPQSVLPEPSAHDQALLALRREMSEAQSHLRKIEDMHMVSLRATNAALRQGQQLEAQVKLLLVENSAILTSTEKSQEAAKQLLSKQILAEKRQALLEN